MWDDVPESAGGDITEAEYYEIIEKHLPLFMDRVICTLDEIENEYGTDQASAAFAMTTTIETLVLILSGSSEPRIKHVLNSLFHEVYNRMCKLN